MSHWFYKHLPFQPTYEQIVQNNWYGFVYSILNTNNNKEYIGKKFFHSKRTLKPLKGRTNKRHRLIESDWRTYTSSSDIVNRDYKLSPEFFHFNILSLHPDKIETNYHETKLQFQLNVLECIQPNGCRKYYNENILQRYYPSAKTHDHRIHIHENFSAIYQNE